MTIVLLLIAEALLALDWRQTITIASNPLKYREIKVSKIIGSHPSVPTVCAYFVFWLAAIPLVTFLCPVSYSWILPALVAFGETGDVVDNRKLFGAWW